MQPIPVKNALDDLAAAIRREHLSAQQALKMSLTHAIRAGELLAEAKRQLGHGRWLPWLATKAKIPPRTAQIYLKLFRAYGDDPKCAARRFSSLRDALRLLVRAVPEDDDQCAGEDVFLPPPIRPVSHPGDLWSLGDHRLLCGDATDPLAVARLLGAREPILLVADPPYGIALDLAWRNRAAISQGIRDSPGHRDTSVQNDTRADWSEAFALAPSVKAAYVFHASSRTAEVYEGLASIGFDRFQQVIWDKERSVIGRTHYSFRHECIWYARRAGAPWYGHPGEQSTIWTAPSPKFQSGSSEEKFEHPTQKPIELMRRPILNHLRPGELVYDPFLGSGTTLAAAEVTGRVCLGVEIDPRYVDVAIQRWEALTGKAATLKGRTFDEVRAERTGRACASTRATVAS